MDNVLREHLALPMSLPVLTDIPSRHPDCCISLSSTLLRTITASLSESIHYGLVLSVGSGAGLLEALLYSMWSSSCASPSANLMIEGVEVMGSATSALHSPNRYLPEHCSDTVKGTWAISTRLKEAVALIFVYPRSSELVRSYIHEASLFTSSLHVILWMGPNCDWTEFKPCFTDKSWVPVRVLGGKEAGLAEYEVMAIIKKS